MSTENNYTFIFDTNNKFTHRISDEFLLGIGFGVIVYNYQNNFLEDAEHFTLEENINPVTEANHDAKVFEGWNIEDFERGEFDEVLKRYVVPWENEYFEFDDISFLQGTFTVFEWLKQPELKSLITLVYDTHTHTYVSVDA